MVVKKHRVPPPLRPIGRIFQEAGYQAYLVGGAVRNILMKLRPTDWDVATDATPEQVITLFRRVIPTGIKHGTVTVLFKDQKVEVTTFRVEGTYSDSRHPDSVTFAPSVEEDLSRRDFTINAMALRLTDGSFVDPFSGMTDLKAKVVRAVGNADERFAEDALRMLRAVRFAAQLEFEIDGTTLAAIRPAVSRIAAVSAERVRDELSKILASRKPSTGFALMQECGLLAALLPELEACVGIEQADTLETTADFGLGRATTRKESFDVFRHSILACDGAPADDLELRLAALLHDVGKAPTFERDQQGNISFHRHEEVSEALTREMLTRLRYPNAVISNVCHLVRNHMFHYEDSWSDAAVRRFIARVEPENIQNLIVLRRADTFGKLGYYPRDRNLEELSERIRSVMNGQQALTARDLAVDGNALHEQAGIPKGPAMGTVIEFLVEAVLEDPAQNTRERLVHMARAFYREHVRPQGKDDRDPVG